MTTVTRDTTPTADASSPRAAVAEADDDAVIQSAVDAVIAAVEDQLQRQKLPTATYRVQFNSRCSFREITTHVPYLHALGISDLYASPFLQARPGSPHGYDIVDHSSINSEIGGIDELRTLRAALRERGMGLIADVVPNHMSATPRLNPWWQDVLENGPSSPFAEYFDIDWMPLKPDLAHKVLLPVLGDQFGKVLEEGQLVVHYGEGSFWLEYGEHRFPIAPGTYVNILSLRLDELQQRLGDEHEDLRELLSILTAIKNLPPRTETDAGLLVERRREKEVIKRRLHNLVQRAVAIADFVRDNVRLINGRRDDPRSFDPLDELLQNQAYRLAFWRVAADEINYRRFFDINDLAAICTEHPDVFLASHRLLFELLDEGTITGLRIDHPDGLYDPRGYLCQLQERHFLRLCRTAFEQQRPTTPCNLEDWPRIAQRLCELWSSTARFAGSPRCRPLFVVVEKILEHGEPLPEDWPVHGTVGYEFLNAVNGLFVDPGSERTLTAFFERFTNQRLDFDELAWQGKRLIARMSMQSELTVLAHRLDRFSERNRRTRDFTLNSLAIALQEVVAGFSVYRTYVEPGRVPERDGRFVEQAIAGAKRRNPAMDASVFDFLRDVLLLRFHADADEQERSAVEQFVGKFQQLTGPVMAKAVEDTAFYRFNRLVSLNEVGGHPAHFGTSPVEFHQLNASRLPWQAHALNASTTHDTKRSEDVRARISVLSEIPKSWREHAQRWCRWNRKFKSTVDGVEAPSRNAEYLLYQTLIGTWPDTVPTGHDRTVYVERLQQYLLKVVREAKVHTSWIGHNEPYEAAVSTFVAGLFNEHRRQPFLEDVQAFATRVADHGRWNSLAQLVLKIASPGVADFYQGTEVWNLTLVDPDNRGPVDFAAQNRHLVNLLAEMAEALNVPTDQAVPSWLAAVPSALPEPSVDHFLQRLLDHRQDGRIKLFATLLSLHLRRRFPELFTTGDYEPLTVTGPHADRLVAFARRHEGQTALAIVPRLTVHVTGFGGPPPVGDTWSDTQIELPPSLAGQRFVDIFSRREVAAPPRSTTSLFASDALRRLPFALLHNIRDGACSPRAAR